MALDDPLALTYNTVAKNLPKINQDNYGAEYFLNDGTNRFTMTVKHTIPKKGASGESHLARIDVEHDDGNGVLERIASAWLVIRTDVGQQDPDASSYVAQMLVDYLVDANIVKIIGRES